MARKLVTEELVAQIAENIVGECGDPSIIEVKERLGGGSFTTIKRYLDVWKQRSAEAKSATPDTPPEFEAKALQFARSVWSLASRLANDEAKLVKDQAAASVAAAKDELDLALREISRLERIESEQSELIEQQQAELHRNELALVEVRVQVSRVAELEQTLAVCRDEATTKGEKYSRLSGETEALRGQVRDLVAALAAARPPHENATAAPAVAA